MSTLDDRLREILKYFRKGRNDLAFQTYSSEAIAQIKAAVKEYLEAGGEL
jgi:hypothetical protein